jgi:hypothetical protein
MPDLQVAQKAGVNKSTVGRYRSANGMPKFCLVPLIVDGELHQTCTKCDTPKKLVEFVKDKRRATGHGSWCIPCSREYMNVLIKTPKVVASRKAHYQVNKTTLNAQSRARWAEKKGEYKVAKNAWNLEHRAELLEDQRRRGTEHRAFIDSLKAGKSCFDCAGTYPPFCMEYDHVRGTKRWALGKMSNHRREAVLEEIAKCDLVCCACHRVRTQIRNTHGKHKWQYGDWSANRLKTFHGWVDTLKSNPCMDCGRIRPSVAMDFDHVRGVKVSGVATMWSWGRDKVLEEIAKCDLVCCICHRIRTQARRTHQGASLQ